MMMTMPKIYDSNDVDDNPLCCYLTPPLDHTVSSISVTTFKTLPEGWLTRIGMLWKTLFFMKEFIIMFLLWLWLLIAFPLTLPMKLLLLLVCCWLIHFFARILFVNIVNSCRMRRYQLIYPYNQNQMTVIEVNQIEYSFVTCRNLTRT